jgi:hypothetical protein
MITFILKVRYAGTSDLDSSACSQRPFYQVVLIGDQKQLPPTIISRDADAAGLGTSLFERMLKRGIRAFMLKAGGSS